MRIQVQDPESFWLWIRDKHPVSATLRITTIKSFQTVRNHTEYNLQKIYFVKESSVSTQPNPDSYYVRPKKSFLINIDRAYLQEILVARQLTNDTSDYLYLPVYFHWKLHHPLGCFSRIQNILKRNSLTIFKQAFKNHNTNERNVWNLLNSLESQRLLFTYFSSLYCTVLKRFFKYWAAVRI
jgi:hypothetical protein